MSLPTWGMLPKSQIDPEKIEEAINRIVKAHNENPEAHLGPGQSLQSHKMSEIIDHRAVSIIADKIADREVPIEKWSWNKFFIQCNFESLDGFFQVIEGTGSFIRVELGEAILRCGSMAGNQTRLAVIYSRSPFVYTKNPFFQLGAVVQTDVLASMDFGFAMGTRRPLLTGQFANDIVGFKYLQSFGKLYAFFTNPAGVEQRMEISGFDLDRRNLYRVELYTDKSKPIQHWQTLKFYVNGVLRHTFADVECRPGDDEIIGIAIRQNFDWGDNLDMQVSNLIFAQDI